MNRLKYILIILAILNIKSSYIQSQDLANTFIHSGDTIKAEILIQKLDSGFNILLDSCSINGSFVYQDTIKTNILIENSFFLDSFVVSNCHFENILFLDNTHFWGKSNFNDCKFNDAFRLDGCFFQQGANFESSIFNNGSIFGNSTFLETLNLKKTEFFKTASFANITCKSSLFFDNSHFFETASFNNLVVSDSASFFLTGFAHDVLFEKTIFRGNISFENTKFYNSAIFIDSRFEIGASFIGTQFKNSVSFSGVNSYLDGTSFKEVLFQSNAMIITTIKYGQFINLDLINVNFYSSNMAYVTFEPKVLPLSHNIASAKNIELMTYEDSPSSLLRLRNQFKHDGFEEGERKITYAIRKNENSNRLQRFKNDSTFYRINWKEEDYELTSQPVSWYYRVTGVFWFVFNWLFFDLTCSYGMDYGRPIILAIILGVICTFIYLRIIFKGRKSALYIRSIVSQDINKKLGKFKQIKPADLAYAEKQLSRIYQFKRFFGYALLYSMMSAFNIGFRDFNFGRWIRLILRKEIDIKATGWARTVSGIQSILSVYFLALWFLCYFYRPFG